MGLGAGNFTFKSILAKFSSGNLYLLIFLSNPVSRTSDVFVNAILYISGSVFLT